MTNEEYRQRRGTHRKFAVTPDEASKAYCQTYRRELAEIQANKRRRKAEHMARIKVVDEGIDVDD